MSTEKKTADNAAELSKSKQKRVERQKKNEQVKREGLIGSIIGILAIALILGAIVFSIVSAIRRDAAIIEPTGDYSRYLTDAGYVQGVNATSVMTIPADYASITVPESEVAYTDELFEEEKQNKLSLHKVVNSETDKAIEDGDEINLDYVGSVDGVEFEGGSTNGAGSKLTIGSGTFIPGFEDQLIGHKVGENFDIDVTFPVDYGSEDLAGKDAVFNITVNGIYEEGEFTDEFVAENLPAYAQTVEEYRQYLAKDYYDSQLDAYITKYIDENSTISKYPSKYVKHLEGVKMYSDQSSYEYMNQMYMQYYGQGIPTFEDYTGLSQEEYLQECLESAQNSARTSLALQAIAEKEGISVTDQDIVDFVEGMYGEGAYDSTVESYGRPYLAQCALQAKVNTFLKDNSIVK